MIVKVDYSINLPYAERLSRIKSIVLEEVERRKSLADLSVVKEEKARYGNSEVLAYGFTCYPCCKPILPHEKEVVFIEAPFNSKTYFHLRCLKQKV